MFHDMGCQGRKIYLLLETQNATKHYRLACPGRGGLHFGSGGRRTGWVSTSNEGATGPAKAATSGGAGGKPPREHVVPPRQPQPKRGVETPPSGGEGLLHPEGGSPAGGLGIMGKLLILT